jgi:hypothetical protein
MLNPVVARSLGQLILIANEERDWWGEQCRFVLSEPNARAANGATPLDAAPQSRAGA